MILNIVRKMRTTKYEYHIQESPDYIAECNYTFGIWTRRILVRDCMRTVACSMKQTNFIFKMLTWIPLFWILSIGLFPKYKIYIGNQLSGETKVSFHTPKRNIVINDHIYELYLHNDNYVSIMMDERQIALVKKNNLTIWGKNCYRVDVSDEADTRLILMLIALIDVMFFPNRLEINAIEYEKTIGKDELHERTLWTSKGKR
ncbi:MAG: hypothetical protein E7397_00250 [Ruminococcaceae bacterium]|nr:hypothetical protein [Oscillospiraceae bacterium]